MKHNKIVVFGKALYLNSNFKTSPVYHQEVISPNYIVCIQPVAIVLKLNYTSINVALACTMHLVSINTKLVFTCIVFLINQFTSNNLFSQWLKAVAVPP